MAVSGADAGGATDSRRRLRARLRERAAARSGVAGGVPIATVSGVASTTPGMISWFDRETPVAMITTKSLQLRPNPGNREPIITEPKPGCFGNAVGLRNPGVEKGVAELTALCAERPLAALLAVSLSGATAEDFAALAGLCAPVADILELNYSCPHASGGYGADIGKDEMAIARITAAVLEVAGELPVLVKLTPNVPDVARMARVAVNAGAAGVTAINTVGPLVYRHAATGEAILSNPPDGRGGQSGEWVRATAVEAVAAIRRELGPEPLIVGMGGVSTAGHVAALVAAGADVVGVGSALARIHQREWPRYLRGLSLSDGDLGRRPAESTRAPGAGMTFREHRVLARRELGSDLFEIDVAPPVPGACGQSVFLWLPRLGEKPFAPAVSRDGRTTFLVKRRGPMTSALGALEASAALYSRGPYGDSRDPAEELFGAEEVFGDPADHEKGRVLLLAAGSGAATLPAVADRLTSRGVSVVSAVGVRHPLSFGAVFEALEAHGPLEVVPDEGVPGRVLDRIPELTAGPAGRTGLPVRGAWVCGPEAFMQRAVRGLVAAGIPAARILLSLERSMRCGVGMCGECHHKGRLTCQYGTVVSAEEVFS